MITCDERNNRILGSNPNIINSKIVFKGSNNILFCEDNVTLKNSNLKFSGSDSIVYLSSNKNNYFLNIDIYNKSNFFMDENIYMDGNLNVVLSEQKNLIIGKQCLFSFGIWMRLSDAHLIYDSATKKRTNYSKSIYIGDHVWVGQNSIILKGTQIGSGSIIGAMSLVSGSSICSNSVWGGNPAKEIKKDIFFLDNCVHRYTDKEIEQTMIYDNDKFVYENKGNVKKFNKIEEDILKLETMQEKLDYLVCLRNIKDKNRFYI